MHAAARLARDGETVELQAREIEIGSIEIVSMPDGNETVFEVECGKGTYVRSLARDIGRLLGCYGHVSALRRLEVAPFDEQARLESLGTPDGLDPAAFAPLDAFLIDPIEALEGMVHLPLNGDAAHRVRMGNPVMALGRDAPVEADEAYVTDKGKLLALGEIRAGQFHPKRVFKG